MTKLLSVPSEKAEQSTPAEKVKQELKGEVKEERECEGGLLMEAIECVAELKELLLKRNYIASGFHNRSVPNEFRCLISQQLTRDPVILSSGMTYDRPFILKWFREGNLTCPHMQQVLSHTDLTPNYLVQYMILQWCKNHGLELPIPLKDTDIEALLIEVDRAQLNTLREKMGSSISDQKDAAKQIHLGTKRNPLFRSLFFNTKDAIAKLIVPLTMSEGELDAHFDLLKDITITLFNLSIDEDNKKPLAEDPQVIPLLYGSLKCGTIITRSKAAASLFMLSALDSNKELIGKSGALKPLLDLIEGGHPSATKNAAQAILNLCQTLENQGRATREGAVRVIVKKIVEGTFVDIMLSILGLLATNSIAIQEMINLGVVGYLLRIMRESTYEDDKAKCAEILYDIVHYDRTTMSEVNKEENRHGSIWKVAENGTSIASRKAYEILSMF